MKSTTSYLKNMTTILACFNSVGNFMLILFQLIVHLNHVLQPLDAAAFSSAKLTWSIVNDKYFRSAA